MMTGICLFFLLSLALFLAFSSMPVRAEAEDPKREDTVPEPVKIADHLYEATWTADFDWRQATTPVVTGPACSGVQNGRYRGRNYDWTYADTDLCVLHAAVSAHRPHASVGVADMGFLVRPDGTRNDAKLPFVTVDGINDAGVCIQVNVIPFGENGLLRHAESGKDKLSGGSVVRYILDYADSVASALALLRDKDIFTEVGTIDELHWMISGPASASDRSLKTVVLEVFPDGQRVTETFVDGKPIMTNFNVHHFDGTPASVGAGFGYERWEILRENFDQADSVMGTFDLMEKVYFSKMYDLYGERFWYSEYNGTDLSKYYDTEALKALTDEKGLDLPLPASSPVPYRFARWAGRKAIRGDVSKTGILAPAVEATMKNYRAQSMQDGKLWITIHTSVYDLENLTLDLQVRESHDHLRFVIASPEK